jgi:two-component system OmpR family sensor kinase/two-component system sensor histidine kinase BaeS
MRMGCGLLVAFVVFNVVVSALFFAFSGAMRPGGPIGPVHPLLVTLFIAFVVLVLVRAGSSMVRVASPLAELMDAAGHVADGDTTVRVRERGPRAVRRVMTAFNAMTERLGKNEAQRRRLLADVTHELRTPLSVIQGQLEGAIDGVYPRDEAHLTAILEETRHMARIIEDLRILSLTESGGLRLQRQAVSLDEIVDDAIDAHAPTASAAGVTLSSAVPTDLPAVDVDPTRLREVLDNLLSNAIRYTPSGGEVTVGAAREGTSEIRASVRDTGRGLAPDELALMFERFHRSPDSRGSGLGLAIARDLVRAHGGTMTAESEGPGRGTTVRFTLPVAT